MSAAWFTLSLINAGLAQSKGRSGLNWWLASLFGGPLATLLIVAWPAVPASVEQADPSDGWRTGVVIGIGILVVILLGFFVFRLAGG